tara:strand:+ start:79 stop:423 length:345 start_codon:yes stop_codon:yes gene_type:complete
MVGSIYGGCGSCSVSKKDAAVPSGDFVTKVNQDGIVNGLVLASCGMCNFGTKDRTCSLSIQINEKAYNVKGTHIDDHGDSHAKDGFCNAVRVAKVSGKVKKNNFIAETFVLQKN